MYHCAHPEAYAGQVVGNGQCVAFVREAAHAPHTSEWRAGVPVRGNRLAAGSAIATFDPSGKYGNHTDGRSHAAILVREEADGLHVWDQWSGQPVHPRVIRFKGHAGDPVNDADCYYIIQHAPAASARAQAPLA